LADNAVAKRPSKGPGSIAPETFEGIRQMYETEPNKSKIARMFGVSLSTVYKALGKVDPEEQRERRRASMGRIAEKMVSRVETLVDGLEIPEEATYMQRATVIGILTDKVEKLDKRLEESQKEDDQQAAPLPETVEALAGILRNEIRALGHILHLDEAKPIVQEVKKFVEAKVVEAEVLSIEDLYGGGGS